MTALSEPRIIVRSPALLVAKNLWLEIRRREEYFALLIMIGVYVAIALIVRFAGATDKYSTSFMLNMGLSASGGLAALVTLLTAARQVPSESENRSIHTVLACPVTRSEFLVGKFLGTTVAGWVVLSAFVLTVWILTTRQPEQQILVFLQAFLVHASCLAKLAGMTLFLSLVLPKAVTILLAGVVFFGGVPLANATLVLAPQTALGAAMRGTSAYLAQLGQIPLFTRFTDGGPPLDWGNWGMLILQNGILTLAMLFLAYLVFERRRI